MAGGLLSHFLRPSVFAPIHVPEVVEQACHAAADQRTGPVDPVVVPECRPLFELSEIRRGRSDRDSSPCSTPPRSHSRASAVSRRRRRLPPALGVRSSNQRRGLPWC